MGNECFYMTQSNAAFRKIICLAQKLIDKASAGIDIKHDLESHGVTKGITLLPKSNMEVHANPSFSS